MYAVVTVCGVCTGNGKYAGNSVCMCMRVRHDSVFQCVRARARARVWWCVWWWWCVCVVCKVCVGVGVVCCVDIYVKKLKM